MPEEGIKLIAHDSVLSFEEIFAFTKVAASKGITKVRITGGEPLVRNGVVNLVRMISSIKEIKDLSMTTNGILLEQYADELKAAGLHRVNISLDTIDPEVYKFITRGGNIKDVFAGIEAAKKAGLSPVKINCVIKKNTEEPDALAVKDFCAKNGLIVRFIDEMDIEGGKFSIVHGGDGGNCVKCNRLRLTSDGYLKPCLFSDISINIRQVDYAEAIEKALAEKPARGKNSHSHKFYNIGG